MLTADLNGEKKERNRERKREKKGEKIENLLAIVHFCH